MKVRHDLMGRVREVENVFIPMPDGCRLAARLFLPVDGTRAPAILEYIPYRKRDFMRERDEPMHRYFAAHGYAVVRVDVRGSGDSDGVLVDEYSAQEHDDGVEVIAWIARQSWCSGSVGMMGISWGGFNALQIAALKPPALRAIITLCAADDRYADDAHYMGGCLLNENLQWGSILMTYNALPPDPHIVGGRWRKMWRNRLDNAVAFPELWMQHPWRDEYWRHGSVSEDYSAIECAVYAIGGWADGYSNAVGRLLEGLSAPRKGLIGPWPHAFPHRGTPGPSIGFLQEALRWWDHWLSGRQTGIMNEPMFRVWMQDSVRPKPQYAARQGRWIAERTWPSTRITPRRWFLNHEGMTHQASPSVRLTVRSPQICGMVAGEWCAFGADGEMPLDQRPDDGRSIVFDSAPLDAPLEIFGSPVADLDIASDAEVALIAVRLNEVAPDGASTRVSYGLLNLTHRDSHIRPTPLVPKKRYRVSVRLNDVAHAFSAGHRIRLAVSTSYWPIAWPGPQLATLTLWTGGSALTLPVRPPDPGDMSLAPFGDPEMAEGARHKPIRPFPFRRTIERNLVTDELIYTLTSDGGEFGNHSRARLEEIDLDLGYSLTKKHRIQVQDPISANSELHQWIELSRHDWHTRIETTTRLGCDRDSFLFTAELRALEDAQVIFERSWDRRIPRRLL